MTNMTRQEESVRKGTRAIFFTVGSLGRVVPFARLVGQTARDAASRVSTERYFVTTGFSTLASISDRQR